MYCAKSVHVKEHHVVKISGALHYGISYDHIMVLGCETPEIIDRVLPLEMVSLLYFIFEKYYVFNQNQVPQW